MYRSTSVALRTMREVKVMENLSTTSQVKMAAELRRASQMEPGETNTYRHNYIIEAMNNNS